MGARTVKLNIISCYFASKNSEGACFILRRSWGEIWKFKVVRTDFDQYCMDKT